MQYLIYNILFMIYMDTGPVLTCSAGRVLGESGEGLQGGEAGSHRLPPLVVDRVVHVAGRAGLNGTPALL